MAKKPTYEELEQRVNDLSNKLEQTKHNVVEQQVEERTAELAKSNDELKKEIGERKQAEATLQKSKEKYRGLIEGLDEAIYHMSLPDGKYEYMSPAARKVFGYSAEEFMENPLFMRKVIHPSFAEYFKEKWADLIEGKMPPTYKYKILDPEENERWIVQSNTGIFDERGNIIGIEGLCRDITKGVQAEDSLRESESFFSQMFEQSTTSTCLYNPDGTINRVNKEFCKMFGVEEKVIINAGYNVFEDQATIDAGAIPLLRDIFDEKKNKNWETIFDIDVASASTETPTSRSGKIFLEVFGYPVLNRKGNLEYVVLQHYDITERKRTEEVLRESEEKYRTILETIEDGYYEIDLGGNFTFFNDSMCKISGYSRDELMGMNNRQYTDENIAKKLYQTFNRVYTTGKPDKNFHWPVIRKDSTERTVAASVSLRRDTEGEPIGFRGIVRDISERKRFEAQFQQAQKMEAIATLAGGVAHEFNNALMAVMGNIELLKMEFPEDERKSKYLEAMNESGHRMSRLTDQLLAYAQGGQYQPRDLKLDDFTIETLPILQHDLSPEVRVETRFQKNISYIRADHAQMQMVLSAIMANSNEAIEDEGVIRIAAENKNIDEAFTKQHPGLKPGPYVSLTIEDSGKGMDEETKDGIFEPFFTTKFQGRGMGMAAVYGIVKNHGGYIYVDSELGKGTVVRIYLPPIEAKEEVKENVVLSPKTEIAKGEGTILVIEDEETLVGLFRKILERLGYRVLLAETGKEAVALAKTFDGQIDLALLDIKLPDMDGGRVYPLIMEARPGLKVIVCSGYSIHGPAQDILDAGAEGFIQKPFLIAALAEKLKEVLEGK